MGRHPKPFTVNEPATAGKRCARGVASGEGGVNQVMNRR
jgi:hypothetical protein